MVRSASASASSHGLAALSVKAGQAATSVFMGNMLQKLVTFVFNTLLVRKTNPHIFGVAAVQLELLLSTLLFLSREGVRLAVVKEGHRGGTGVVGGDSSCSASTQRQEHQKLVNLSWLPVLLLVAGSAAILGQLSSAPLQALLPAPVRTPSDNGHGGDDSGNSASGVSTLVVLLYCAGALLECSAEPWLNLYAVHLAAGAKVKAEGAAVAVRRCVCLCTCVCGGMRACLCVCTSLLLPHSHSYSPSPSLFPTPLAQCTPACAPTCAWRSCRWVYWALGWRKCCTAPRCYW